MKDKYKKILYVHGLGGTMNGSTVNNIKNVFTNSNVISFDFPNNPILYQKSIYDKISLEKPDLIIASSLGAFMVTSVLYKYNILTKTIIINPALTPKNDIFNNFGCGIKEYRNKRMDNIQTYTLDLDYYEKLEKLESEFLANIEKNIKLNIIGIFSTNDEYFSHINDYKSLINNNLYIVNDTHHVSKETIEYIKNVL